MSKKTALLILVCGTIPMTALSGCVSPDVRKTRNMPINQIDLDRSRDGTYMGEYSYGSFAYTVEVTVHDHRITKIVIVQNRGTTHALKAEGVIPEIIEEQRNDVDVISGATSTSNALLKAVEEALAKSLY